MEKTFEEAMQELVGNIRRLIHEEQTAYPLTLGQVAAAGDGDLRILADGMTLGREDLYVNALLLREADALVPGDRVILLRSEDGQDYYVLAKAVRMP